MHHSPRLLSSLRELRSSCRRIAALLHRSHREHLIAVGDLSRNAGRGERRAAAECNSARSSVRTRRHLDRTRAERSRRARYRPGRGVRFGPGDAFARDDFQNSGTASAQDLSGVLEIVLSMRLLGAIGTSASTRRDLRIGFSPAEQSTRRLDRHLCFTRRSGVVDVAPRHRLSPRNAARTPASSRVNSTPTSWPPEFSYRSSAAVIAGR